MEWKAKEGKGRDYVSGYKKKEDELSIWSVWVRWHGMKRTWTEGRKEGRKEGTHRMEKVVELLINATEDHPLNGVL